MNAQDYLVQVQQYSVDEGLSDREVHHIFEDSHGLIWVSTRYGLNRFNGREFTWFTKEKNGLSNNDIQLVIEDDAGWLWVASAKEGRQHGWDNIDKIHTKTLEVVPWQSDKTPFEPTDISNIWANPDKVLFINTYDGKLWKYSSSTSFSEFNLPNLQNFIPKYFSSNEILWGAEYKKQESNWVGINTQGEVIHKFNHPTAPGFLSSIGETNNQVWYNRWQNRRRTFFFIELPSGRHHKHDLNHPSLGNLAPRMPGADHGLNINPVDQSLWWSMKNEFVIEIPQSHEVHLLGDKYPGLKRSRFILFDKSGIGWVGTTLGGLYRIQVKPFLFENFLSADFLESTLNNRIECRGMLETENEEVLVTSYQGIFRLSNEGQILESDFLDGPKWASKVIYEGRDGNIWFGRSNQSGPVKQDAQNGVFTNYPPPADKSLDIWCIYEQPSGKMWFAGMTGTFAFLETGADTLQWFQNYKGFEELKDANILAMEERLDKQVWLATSTGLYLFDPVKQKILQRYWSEGTGQYYIPHNNIHHIFQEGENLLWLATGGGGLIKLQIAPGEKQINQQNSSETQAHIQQFTKADGLSSNMLYAVYPDDFGNLWMSSEHGIIQFNKATAQSIAFLPKDGLPHYEFNRISHYQTKDGRLYFGSLNGLTTFHPRDFQNIENEKHPPLVITDYQQYDKDGILIEGKKKDLFQNQSIILQPDDQFFRLEFELLTYQDVVKNQYAYFIKGVDKDWTYQKENTIRFSRLPYGEHTLRIKGQSSDGQWSPNELNLKVIILKPFYLRTWFLTLAIMIMIIAIPAGYKIRTARLKKQKRQLETEVKNRTQTIQKQNEQLEQQAQELRHLDQVKSRFFANVSHELRTPLTLLLGPMGSILKSNQLNNRNFTLLKKAQLSGKNLLKLINEILDLSKMESGRMLLNETSIKVYPLLRRIFSQFESYSRLKGLQFTFEYHASEDLQILLDRDKFEKTVNNFLSNAFKFTPKDGKVILRLEESDSALLLSVADTGQGIHPDDVPHVFDRFYQTNRPDAPAEGGTGIGLALVNEFAQLFEGKTWVESTLNQGSTFFFQFPKKIEMAENWEAPPTDAIQEADEFIPPPSPEVLEIEPPVKARLLVVEDNPGLRDYLSLILEEKYEVVTAENGQAALEWLCTPPNPLPAAGGGSPLEPAPKPRGLSGAQSNNPKPSLILSDIMMPVMDGYQLLEKLKSDDLYRHIPVVMLTARADLRDKLKALRIGVDDYLVKPFEEEELLVRIQNLLANYHNRQMPSEETNEPDKPRLSQAEADWLADLESKAQKGLEQKLLSVNWLANQANLSERQFRRRLQKTSGLTPQQYLTELRLQEARGMLEVGKFSTISEVAYSIGFNDAAAFSRSFRNYFGKSPSEFLPT